MTRTILSIAYPFAALGPGAVGGAEQILTTLEAEIVRRGHRSVVVAHEASICAGRLFPTSVPDALLTEEVRAAVTKAHQANIDRALASAPIDLVHMHGIDFWQYRLPRNLPILVTLHLPPSWYPEEIWSLPPNVHLQCVSEHQRLSCPVHARDRLTVIPNGVLIPPADTLPKRRDYALMLARICPEKNLHTGLDAARLAGVPAILAGEAFPYPDHLRYLHEEIEPRLGDRARLLPPVGGAKKLRLLAKARRLLLPTLAPETSSLVAMEALAAGTPVIAFPSGAIPEIVEHGRTGFLVHDVHEMADAITRTSTLDHAVCRSVAATRFSVATMLERYLALYKTTLENRIATESAHKAQSVVETPQESQPDAIKITVLTTIAELEALLPEWQTLWQADPNATPFQSPEWLLPWWKHLGEGDLYTLTLRDAGTYRLRALLPLYIYTQPATGERHLLLIGAGTSDYLDGLFAPGCEHAAHTALRHLIQNNAKSDRAILHQLRPFSPLLAAAQDLCWSTSPSESCSSVQVTGWPALPARIRANSGRYRRRAEARGKLTSTIATTPESALALLDTLISWNTARWQTRGQTAVLATPSVQGHHRESIPLLLAAGLLRMLSVELDSQTIAVLYALIDPASSKQSRRLYCYLPAFDSRFADLSPGTLLLSAAFDLCEAEGIAHLDMLRGDEVYKHLWGAVPEPTFSVELPPGSPASSLAGAAQSSSGQ